MSFMWPVSSPHRELGKPNDDQIYFEYDFGEGVELFVIVDTDGFHVVTENIPTYVKKREIANVFVALLQRHANGHMHFHPARNDISLHIGTKEVMRLSKDGVWVETEPSRPFDYWTLKEVEKEWQTYIKERKN